MVFPRSTGGSGRRRGAIAGAATALVMGASLLAAPVASADSSPSVQQLYSACSWADYCVFHAQNYWTYTGNAHQVGPKVYNCGSVSDSQSLSWSNTTETTNSIGISVTAGGSLTVGEEAFEASITDSYEHSWGTSYTTGQTDTVNVPADNEAWVTRGTAMQGANGWYELHFKKRYYGHYIWYIENYTENSFNSDHPSAGWIAFHNKPLSSGQYQSICR